MAQPYVSNQEFHRIYHEIAARGGVMEDLRKALGLSRTCSIRKRRARMRSEGWEFVAFGEAPASLLPVQAPSTPYGSRVPLSEDQRKFHPEWTATDCVAELQRVANIDTNRVVSRNWFRIHSEISEATWNRYFGTFHEFKRQAGIVLSRQQHHLEKQIARHASVDHYRTFRQERGSYEGKYLRPSGQRFKTALIMSDLHDMECDPFFLEVAIDVARRLQPTYVNFNGDIFDLPEFGRYNVDPRQWDVVGRMRFVHEKIFAPLRAAAPDAQFDFVEGNHEHRLLKHMADATPALMTVLADLHGLSVSKLLGLDRFQINYIAKADLAAYTLSNIKEEVGRNFKVYDDMLLCHHFPDGRRMGMPGVNGHNHRYQVWSEYNHVFGSYNWIQAGCGHVRDATYCNGEAWNLGFTIAWLDTHRKLVNFEYVPITDFAVAGGKFYSREECV